MKNDRREEKGFEAYIEKEFMGSENDIAQESSLHNSKHSFQTYMVYAVFFVIALIVFGITGTYAYYTMEVENKFNTTSTNSNTDCFSVSLSSTDSNVLGTYNYPITDDFATKDNHLTPLKVTVNNTCKSGVVINYALYLTTLPNAENNVPDSAMKINVVKDGTTKIDKKMINTLTPVLNTSGTNNIYNVLHNAISQKGSTPDAAAAALVDGNYYKVLDGQISPNSSDTYNFTFWVDYNEGTAGNNKTAGKDFKALISAIIN